MIKKLNESEISYTYDLDAIKSWLKSEYRNDDRVQVYTSTRPTTAVRVEIYESDGSEKETVWIFRGSSGFLKAKTDIDNKVYSLVSEEAALNLVDSILNDRLGESVKRSNRRCSNRMNEAQSYSGGFTVQDLANVAIGSTEVEIYNRKSENYIAYQEYLKDVVRDNPEIASCEVLYLSARGNNRLILEVNCDYTEESKNWR